MGNIIANSKLELKQVDDLLIKSVPSYRQAYSDRTAWIMACMAELSYLKFNPLLKNEKHSKYFAENISKLVSDNKKSSLLKLIDILGYDHDEERKNLESELKLLKIKLLETFDTAGTQAILVSFSGFIILAFRGTEATSFKDIKSDAKATTTSCELGGKIHSGFNEAFQHVFIEIQNKLDEETFKDKPLFITGHSLGGALATLAAKKLSHSAGIAACYTFGSPRVGDEEWTSNIKTPIYRLVNAADSVTMLPPSSDTISLIGWGLQLIPNIGKTLRTWLLSKFGGYLHCGDMRYLTNCSTGKYDNVKLLYSVSFLYRVKGILFKKLPWKKFLSDHSMSIYRKKLAIVALNRNINN